MDLEKILLIMFIVSLVFLLLTLTLLGIFIYRKVEIKKVNKSRNKKKSRRKKIKLMEKKNKKTLILFFITLFLGIISSGGVAYIGYYQAINLSETDKENVVKAYYLLVDFNEELEMIKDESIDEKKSAQNIQNLSGTMASYNGLSASSLNKKDGQIILNRYYNSIKEIGINASSQAQDFFYNEDLVDEFLEDIQKSKNYEQEVFKYYKVNQKELKKNE